MLAGMPLSHSVLEIVAGREPRRPGSRDRHRLAGLWVDTPPLASFAHLEGAEPGEHHLLTAGEAARDHIERRLNDLPRCLFADASLFCDASDEVGLLHIFLLNRLGRPLFIIISRSGPCQGPIWGRNRLTVDPSLDHRRAFMLY